MVNRRRKSSFPGKCETPHEIVQGALAHLTSSYTPFRRESSDATCVRKGETARFTFDYTCVPRMNLYLSAVDDLMRHHDDKPTISLLLCRKKNRVVVEYALRDLKKPVGVAHWETRIIKSLPKELKDSLPTVEQIERELRDGE